MKDDLQSDLEKVDLRGSSRSLFDRNMKTDHDEACNDRTMKEFLESQLAKSSDLG